MLFVGEIATVIAIREKQKMNNTELRYNRYIKELEEIEKKRARKVKQILEIKKRLSA